MRLTKIIFIWLLIVVNIDYSYSQQTNYDESKIPHYVLPDPLIKENGERIKNKKEWINDQRPHIYREFEQNVYGKFPTKNINISTQLKSIDEHALSGKAIKKEITIYFSTRDSSASMDMLLYLPKKVSHPVPLFLGYNFRGNHCVSTDSTIALSTRWISPGIGVINNKANEAARGSQASRWPIDEIIARGYGLATMYYGDIEPDYPEGWKTGIRTTLATQLEIKPAEWSAIGAWAWGLTQAINFLETQKEINANQIILTGHSRLDKVALWAGASDERFAIVIANDSGEGGAALSRRIYGETIKDLNTNFPHWFVEKYSDYNDNPEGLPIDQHMLLALMAPRPLYVCSAVEDQWADPKGEFLSAREADVVYEIFKEKGIEADQMPQLNQPGWRLYPISHPNRQARYYCLRLDSAP